MATKTTTAVLQHPEGKAQLSALCDFLYGTKERAQRTIGLAYLALALGIIMQSSAYHVVCMAP